MLAYGLNNAYVNANIAIDCRGNNYNSSYKYETKGGGVERQGDIDSSGHHQMLVNVKFGASSNCA